MYQTVLIARDRIVSKKDGGGGLTLVCFLHISKNFGVYFLSNEDRQHTRKYNEMTTESPSSSSGKQLGGRNQDRHLGLCGGQDCPQDSCVDLGMC